MANDAKSSLSNFCLTNVRNLKVFLEVHGRDIAFAKSEQLSFDSHGCRGSSSKIALAISQEETYTRVILHCMHCLTLSLATHTKKIMSFDGKTGGSHGMLISDVFHNYQF